MEHHSTQATALATSTAPTSATGGPSQGSGGAAASQGGPSAPPPKSRRSRRGGKGSSQASGGQGSQSGTSSTAQNRTTPPWPSFYNRGPAPSRCGPVRGLHWRLCLRALPSRLSWRSSTLSSRRRLARPWSMLASVLHCPSASSPRQLVPRPGISNLWHQHSAPWR
jgi:hypothetical protein